jgi:hypothetical protein
VSWFIGYGLIVFLVAVTFVGIKNEKDSKDLIVSALFGIALGLCWPLVVLSFCVAFLGSFCGRWAERMRGT